MSEFDELYTDLTTDPEAVKPGWERSAAVTRARFADKSRRTAAVRKHHTNAQLEGLTSDPKRADRALRRFSWQEGE